MTSRHSAEVLSSIPKYRKAVMFLIGKYVCVGYIAQNHSWRAHTPDNVHKTCEITCDWTHVRIFESSQLEVLYIGDLL